MILYQVLLFAYLTVIGQMVSEDGEYVKRETLESLISVCDIFPSPVDLSMLFRNDEYRTIEAFQRWIISYPDMASFSKWLLTEESSVLELEGEPDSLTFYQTLAQTYKGELLFLNKYTTTLLAAVVIDIGSPFFQY